MYVLPLMKMSSHSREFIGWIDYPLLYWNINPLNPRYMHNDKYKFVVTVRRPNRRVPLILSTLAETKWEAIEKTFSRFSHVQPDRECYKASRSRN
jgi:hypothetical protein